MTDADISALIDRTLRTTARRGFTYPAVLPYDAKLGDLGMDSVSLVEAVVVLEEQMRTSFTDTELGRVQTLRDLARLIRTRVPAPQS